MVYFKEDNERASIEREKKYNLEEYIHWNKDDWDYGDDEYWDEDEE